MPAFVAKDEAYILERSIPEPNTGCWLWLLGLDADGYAIVGFEPWTGHALSFKIWHGPVPQGSEIDHICEMRCCVNPDHLRPLSHLENVRRRKVNGGAERNKAKTHCPFGHAYTPENTRVEKSSAGGIQRRCKTCQRKRDARRYKKQSHNGEV